MKSISLLVVAMLLSACATQGARDSWVAPETVADPEKYKADYDVCSHMAMDHYVRVRQYSPQPSNEQAANMMLEAMRACLKDQGYTPRR